VEKEIRLSKRLGLLRGMEQFLLEVTYAKLHKDNFRWKKQVLWKEGETEGKAEVE